MTDTSFWQQALSAGDPEPGKPKLAWPGPAEDQTAKSMRGGLGHFVWISRSLVRVCR